MLLCILEDAQRELEDCCNTKDFPELCTGRRAYLEETVGLVVLGEAC